MYCCFYSLIFVVVIVNITVNEYAIITLNTIFYIISPVLVIICSLIIN